MGDPVGDPYVVRRDRATRHDRRRSDRPIGRPRQPTAARNRQGQACDDAEEFEGLKIDCGQFAVRPARTAQLPIEVIEGRRSGANPSVVRLGVIRPSSGAVHTLDVI